MYCSSCGSAITPNLAYCNKCGARVNINEATLSKREIAPELLIAGMVGLFVLGLGVIMGLMAVMKEIVGLNPNVVLGISLVFITIFVLLEGIFTYLLFRGRPTREQKDENLLKQNTTRELENGSPVGLPPHMTSVTEHTTRAFDPAYIERK